jgi:hypothetical protein
MIIKEIIKAITPDIVVSLWRKYNENIRKLRLMNLKRNIVNYLESHPENMDDEKRLILSYLKYHPLSFFPYSYTEQYNSKEVVVYIDSEKKMPYTLQDGKRLYFKKKWNKEIIQKYYNGLLMEQDIASPHHYETTEFYVANGDVVVDAGAAEGNFALSIVEKVKKIYLFEVDEEWIEVLKITFAPWKNKVTIINKYVSDNNIGNCITMDSFFEQEQIDFIKADIEGAESQLLAGAKAILSRQTHTKIVLCTYHKCDDAAILNRMLIEQGFNTEFSKGYVIFLHEAYNITPPYLRRGLIRATKH